MPDLKEVRTSLEVGFTTGCLPEKFLRYRGRATRSHDGTGAFPYEDAQFQAVILDGRLFSSGISREIHRVLRPDGWLFFEVDGKTGSNRDGYTLSAIYSVLKDGFNIVAVERPSWWRRFRGDGRIAVFAQKKKWRKTKVYGGRVG